MIHFVEGYGTKLIEYALYFREETLGICNGNYNIICIETNFMFQNCTSLTKIDIAWFILEDVNSMIGMFSGCSKLETIYGYFDYSDKAGMASLAMFDGCIKLIGGNGTKYNPQHKDASYARVDEDGTPGYFTLPPSPEIYGALSGNGQTLIIYYDEKREERGGVTDWSVYNNSPYTNPDTYETNNVTKIVIDESMQDASPESTANWFAWFKKVTTIEHLDYLFTYWVTDMSSMFYNMSVTSLDVTGFDTHNVINMSAMFASCTDLTDLDVSGFNTRSVKDMHNMFSSCMALTTIDVSNFKMDKVANVNDMFYYCVSLTTIYCDNDWSQLSNIIMSSRMFEDCSLLVGGNGTAYNAGNANDLTFARPDESGKPGYFTHTATGIEDIVANDSNRSPAKKVMLDGTLYIVMPDDSACNMQGQHVR